MNERMRSLEQHVQRLDDTLSARMVILEGRVRFLETAEQKRVGDATNIASINDITHSKAFPGPLDKHNLTYSTHLKKASTSVKTDIHTRTEVVQSHIDCTDIQNGLISAQKSTSDLIANVSHRFEVRHTRILWSSPTNTNSLLHFVGDEKVSIWHKEGSKTFKLNLELDMECSIWKCIIVLQYEHKSIRWKSSEIDTVHSWHGHGQSRATQM